MCSSDTMRLHTVLSLICAVKLVEARRRPLKREFKNTKEFQTESEFLKDVVATKRPLLSR